MRTLTTLLTLVAAVAGYVYLQQPPEVGELYESDRSNPVFFNWRSAADSNSQRGRVPVEELVGRIHEHTRSVLDDFANQHGGQSDGPIEDAFERLKQVTESLAAATSAASETAPVDEHHKQSVSSTLIPNIEEIRRKAFETTSAESSPSASMKINPLPDDVAARNSRESSENSSTETPVTAIASSNKSEDLTAQDAQSSIASSSVPIVSSRSQTTVSPQICNDVVSRPQARSISNRTAKYVSADWKVVGKSTEGRPMHTMHLGENGTRTLVIAGLNGEDSTAVRWLELLTEELRRHPELLKNNEVVFFRAGNPDGLTRRTRHNARGVPINRNFPSRQYRPALGLPAFAVPASEIETRLILDTLYSFRPRRVIHLTSTSGRPQVAYNRLAKKLADDFVASTSVTAQIFDSEQFPGSLEDFADGTLQAAVLSFRLASDNDWQKAWRKVQDDVLATVVGQPVGPKANQPVQPEDPDRTPIPPPQEEEVVRRPLRKGYEELPPPPQQ